jgi:LytS/YehU family sensor histidine kinase
MLKYSIDVDENILGIEIPPMSIQILAENAIKHGISQLADGGEINLSIQMEDDLVIRVENTGTLKKSTDGTGLKNAIERIKMLCSPEALFDLVSNGQTVTAQITIPRP